MSQCLKFRNLRGRLVGQVPWPEGGFNGPQGPKGDQGEQGLRGRRGSFWFSGAGPPATLPPDVRDHDHYVDVLTGDFYMFHAGAFHKVGP